MGRFGNPVDLAEAPATMPGVGVHRLPALAPAREPERIYVETAFGEGWPVRYRVGFLGSTYLVDPLALPDRSTDRYLRIIRVRDDRPKRDEGCIMFPHFRQLLRRRAPARIEPAPSREDAATAIAHALAPLEPFQNAVRIRHRMPAPGCLPLAGLHSLETEAGVPVLDLFGNLCFNELTGVSLDSTALAYGYPGGPITQVLADPPGRHRQCVTRSCLHDWLPDEHLFDGIHSRLTEEGMRSREVIARRWSVGIRVDPLTLFVSCAGPSDAVTLDLRWDRLRSGAFRPTGQVLRFPRTIDDPRAFCCAVHSDHDSLDECAEGDLLLWLMQASPAVRRIVRGR